MFFSKNAVESASRGGRQVAENDINSDGLWEEAPRAKKETSSAAPPAARTTRSYCDAKQRAAVLAPAERNQEGSLIGVPRPVMRSSDLLQGFGHLGLRARLSRPKIIKPLVLVLVEIFVVVTRARMRAEAWLFEPALAYQIRLYLTEKHHGGHRTIVSSYGCPQEPLR